MVGDARIKLAKEPSEKFDLLLLDAFSSDSVPTHLLTREAMQLYLDRLKPERRAGRSTSPTATSS